MAEGSELVNHIMIDLEMNKIERRYNGDKKLSSELIEIGAVKMDSKFDVIDQYQTYVMPSYGKMNSRIIKLTGITDDKLEGAPDFFEALDSFASWIGNIKTVFYSWSMSDIHQFQVEAAFKGYKGKIIEKKNKKHYLLSIIYQISQNITTKIANALNFSIRKKRK